MPLTYVIVALSGPNTVKAWQIGVYCLQVPRPKITGSQTPFGALILFNTIDLILNFTTFLMISFTDYTLNEMNWTIHTKWSQGKCSAMSLQ